MDLGTVFRLGAAILLAVGGLFVATRTHFTLSSDKLGVILFALAVLWGYRTVARHFDRQDGGE